MRPVLTTFAAILIALVGFASATMLAPDRGDAMKAQSMLAFGSGYDDFCGDQEHDHRCPLCRVVADPPDMAIDPLAVHLQPFDGWRRLADLTRSAQARNLNHSPRAPPARA
ncbi:hypothetical protein [Pseudooceanicola sp. LIPI14-2-Ac024]|uniref:hypothetical protein n=1 Tax=Pseudooceanicola sp. LIPI14-2-Ac024 TaxID=3344875 RepID=UPI0035CF2AC0